MSENPTVKIAKCPKCGNPVKLAVSTSIDKSLLKEFAKLMGEGCEIVNISLADARKAKMCFMNC